MNGATQVINLAAGYLAPEFRGRRVRSFTDLVELLGSLFNLLRQASGSAVFAILSDVDARLEYFRNHLSAKAWHAAVTRIRQHPFMSLIKQDPVTEHGLTARLYAGRCDARSTVSRIERVAVAARPDWERKFTAMRRCARPPGRCARDGT